MTEGDDDDENDDDDDDDHFALLEARRLVGRELKNVIMLLILNR